MPQVRTAARVTGAVVSKTVSARELRVLRRLLETALDHINSELSAAGWDEVKQHPILRAKYDFVERARKRLKELDAV
jgi:hypothetical protein